MRISRGERLALPEILRERFQDPRDLDAVGPGPRDQQLLDLLYLLFLRGGGGSCCSTPVPSKPLCDCERSSRLW